MIVIPHTVIRTIAMFKAKEDVRYYLKGCLLETGPKGAYLVGTDGSALAAARVSEESLPERQVIIPADTIDQLAKLKKVVGVSVEIDGYDGACNGQQRTITFNTHEGQTFMCKELDGRYPEWRRVIMRVDVPNHETVFDPEYLARVQKAGQIFGRKCTFVKPNGMSVGYAQLDNEGLVGAWVMPMREKPSDWPCGPVWSI